MRIKIQNVIYKLGCKTGLWYGRLTHREAKRIKLENGYINQRELNNG